VQDIQEISMAVNKMKLELSPYDKLLIAEMDKDASKKGGMSYDKYKKKYNTTKPLKIK